MTLDHDPASQPAEPTAAQRFLTLVAESRDLVAAALSPNPDAAAEDLDGAATTTDGDGEHGGGSEERSGTPAERLERLVVELFGRDCQHASVEVEG